MNEWKKEEKCLKKCMFGKKESFRKHLEEIKNIHLEEEREGFLKEGRKVATGRIKKGMLEEEKTF